jgi:AraC-like DNA-binding protein
VPDGSRIDHERARGLLDLAVTLTGRDDLGVLAAQAVEPGHFELVELASRSQRTVGEALRTLAPLLPMLHDGVRLTTTSDERSTRVQVRLLPDPPVHPAGYDFIVASLVIAGRRQTRNPELMPLRVRVPYTRATGPSPLASFLSCPIELGAEAVEIEFPTAFLEMALSRANAPLGHALAQTARELLEKENEPSALEHAVREQVRANLHGGDIDAKTLARKLHMSERTLRRHLDGQGIGLRALIDGVRKDLAMEQLADANRSTEEIAEALGFTTAQAFHRAFRRWTGGTVQAFRDAAKAGARR